MSEKVTLIGCLVALIEIINSVMMFEWANLSWNYNFVPSSNAYFYWPSILVIFTSHYMDFFYDINLLLIFIDYFMGF